MQVMNHCSPSGSAGQPLGRAFAPLGSRLLLVATARRPGRPGSSRYHLGLPREHDLAQYSRFVCDLAKKNIFFEPSTALTAD